jgi:hypothetical protein
MSHEGTFYLPYEETKVSKNKMLCLVKDQGIYLLTCLAIPDTKPLVCYAQGRGKDAQMNGQDYCEKIPLIPSLVDALEKGADLVIDMVGKNMKIQTTVKANQLPNNKNTNKMAKVKSIAEKAAEMESTDTKTIDPTNVVKKKKKKKKKSGTESITSKENLTEANVTKAAKDAQTERQTKYIYPDDVKTNKEKKDFRRKARATIEAFNKKISKLTKSEAPADKKELKETTLEFNEWKAEFLSPEEA